MKIKTVTITGADDKTNYLDLIQISERFPFVEWGLLFSPKRKSEPRYPSIGWVNMMSIFRNKEMKFSAHLCGGYTKELIETSLLNFAFKDIGNLLQCGLFGRKQMNFNSSDTDVCDAFYSRIKLYGNVIIQHNKANTYLCERIIGECASIKGHNIDFLYDGSGGRGVIPEKWKGVIHNHFTGYAGGLTPDNLEDELIKIQSVVGNSEIWIDTETGVRTNDKLDISKVIKFLEIAKKYT